MQEIWIFMLSVDNFEVWEGREYAIYQNLIFYWISSVELCLLWELYKNILFESLESLINCKTEFNQRFLITFIILVQLGEISIHDFLLDISLIASTLWRLICFNAIEAI